MIYACMSPQTRVTVVRRVRVLSIDSLVGCLLLCVQVGRSLYLSGKHKQAIDVYEEAQRIGIDDWEVYHNKGLCHLYLKNYAQAIDDFKQANAIQRHDATYMQLGKVYTLQENYEAAIDVYLEALE